MSDVTTVNRGNDTAFNGTRKLIRPHLPPTERLKAAHPHVSLVENPADAVRGADVVSTDVWTSMGQEAEGQARRAALRGYTVDEALLADAAPGAIVLHCLPAHRGEEISAEVMEGPQCLAFPQAGNRMHGQKALLKWLLT